MKQLNRHKIVFLCHQGDSKELLTDNLVYLSTVCSASLKNLRELHKWRTNEELAADEQYLKVMSLINRKRSTI